MREKVTARILRSWTTARPCSALLWFPTEAFAHPTGHFTGCLTLGLGVAPVGLVALPAAGVSLLSNKGIPAEVLAPPCSDSKTSPAAFDH